MILVFGRHSGAWAEVVSPCDRIHGLTHGAQLPLVLSFVESKAIGRNIRLDQMVWAYYYYLTVLPVIGRRDIILVIIRLNKDGRFGGGAEGTYQSGNIGPVLFGRMNLKSISVRILLGLFSLDMVT